MNAAVASCTAGPGGGARDTATAARRSGGISRYYGRNHGTAYLADLEVTTAPAQRFHQIDHVAGRGWPEAHQRGFVGILKVVRLQASGDRQENHTNASPSLRD